jgi:hypothetical protein
MSLDAFRWLLGGVMLLELMLGIFLSNGAGLGVSAEWANEAYQFAAGSSVWSLGLAVLNICLYAGLMKATKASTGKPVIGVFKRWLAFWIDFVWVMFSVSPVLGLLPVFLEAKHTGHFVWSFERSTRAPTDIPVAIFAGIVLFGALLFYFAIPILCARPSPGACLLGYQVLPAEQESLTLGRAMRRSLMGFLAVCCAPLAPFVDGTNLLKVWLDDRFGTRTVTLKS